MAQKTLTANATATISANGTSTTTGSISWTAPSLPSGVTSWDSIVISGTWTWSGKGNVTVTINGTATSTGTPFNITLSKTQTSPLSITCRGNNKNATGSNFTWQSLIVTYTYTIAGVTYTINCLVEGDGGTLTASSYTVEEGDTVTIVYKGIAGKELFIKEWYVNGSRVSQQEGIEINTAGGSVSHQVLQNTTFKMVTQEITYEDTYDCLVTTEDKTITISAQKKTYRHAYATILSDTIDISTQCLVNGNATTGNQYTFGGTTDYTITYNGNSIYTGRVEVQETILYNVTARIEGAHGQISIDKNQVEYGQEVEVTIGQKAGDYTEFIIYNSTINGSFYPILVGSEVGAWATFRMRVPIERDSEIIVYTREITYTTDYTCQVTTEGNTIKISARKNVYKNSYQTSLYDTVDISTQCLVNNNITSGNTYTFNKTCNFTITYNGEIIYSGHIEVAILEDQYTLFLKGEYNWQLVTDIFKRGSQWSKWELSPSLFPDNFKLRKLTIN